MTGRHPWLVIGLATLLASCGGSDDSSPTTPGGDGTGGTQIDPNAIVLLDEDFEGSIAWNDAPKTAGYDVTEDWQVYYGPPTNRFTVRGTRRYVDEQLVSVSTEAARTGTHSLVLESRCGVSGEITSTGGGYYWDVGSNRYFGTGNFTGPVRHYDLTDYKDGDVVTLRLSLKPLAYEESLEISSASFSIFVNGSGGGLEHLEIDEDTLRASMGSWIPLEIDLSAYTGWVDDLYIRIGIAPGGRTYRWQLTDNWDGKSDVDRPEDLLRVVVAVDDIVLQVVPVD